MKLPLTARVLSFFSGGNPNADRSVVQRLLGKQVSTMDKPSPPPEPLDPPDPPWCGPVSALLMVLHSRCLPSAHLPKSAVLSFRSCSFDSETQLVSAGAAFAGAISLSPTQPSFLAPPTDPNSGIPPNPGERDLTQLCFAIPPPWSPSAAPIWFFRSTSRLTFGLGSPPLQQPSRCLENPPFLPPPGEIPPPILAPPRYILFTPQHRVVPPSSSPDLSGTRSRWEVEATKPRSVSFRPQIRDSVSQSQG